MSTIPQNSMLLKHLFELLQAHRAIFHQERTYQRVVALVLAEVFVFARHTVTQLLFSQGRFDAAAASAVLFEQTLARVGPDDLYVVAGDGAQTPRSSRRLEGSGWLRNLRTPPDAGSTAVGCCRLKPATVGRYRNYRCHWKRSSSGPGSDGSWRFVTANSKPASGWATSSASTPTRRSSVSSGVPGSMPSCCWPATAPSV